MDAFKLKKLDISVPGETTIGDYINIGTVQAGSVSDSDQSGYTNPETVSDTVDPITCYEAENMHLWNYKVEHVGDFASGGEVIKLTGHEGSAKVNFDGLTGVYDMVVGYYDEDDGEAHATVLMVMSRLLGIGINTSVLMQLLNITSFSMQLTM